MVNLVNPSAVNLVNPAQVLVVNLVNPSKAVPNSLEGPLELQPSRRSPWKLKAKAPLEVEDNLEGDYGSPFLSKLEGIRKLER